MRIIPHTAANDKYFTKCSFAGHTAFRAAFLHIFAFRAFIFLLRAFEIFEPRRIPAAQVTFREVDFQDLLHAPPKGGLEKEKPFRDIFMYRRFAHPEVRRAGADRTARLDHILRTADGAFVHILPHQLVPPFGIDTLYVERRKVMMK